MPHNVFHREKRVRVDKSTGEYPQWFNDLHNQMDPEEAARLASGGSFRGSNFNTGLGGEADREKIAEIMKDVKSKGVKLPDPEIFDYAGLSDKFGISLPVLMDELNNNPRYSEEQFNTRLYGNAATMTDVFNTQIPDLKKDGYGAYQVNINKQRYANIIDKNNPNMRSALDIQDKIISEYQTNPDNFFDKQIQTNINTSYSPNPQNRNGYDNIRGVFALVKPNGEYNKSEFENLPVVDGYDQDQPYGGLSSYEQEDIKGISTAKSGVTTFGEEKKGLRSFLVERGKNAETAAKLGAAQVANADYNNFMNEVFGGTSLIRGGGFPNINKTKEYVAKETEGMSREQLRQFRKNFLKMTKEAFEAGFPKYGTIPTRGDSNAGRASIQKMSKTLFGESLGNQAFNDAFIN